MNAISLLVAGLCLASSACSGATYISEDAPAPVSDANAADTADSQSQLQADSGNETETGLTVADSGNDSDDTADASGLTITPEAGTTDSATGTDSDGGADSNPICCHMTSQVTPQTPTALCAGGIYSAWAQGSLSCPSAGAACELTGACTIMVNSGSIVVQCAGTLYACSDVGDW